jgi:hypothetical protein
LQAKEGLKGLGETFYSDTIALSSIERAAAAAAAAAAASSWEQVIMSNGSAVRDKHGSKRQFMDVRSEMQEIFTRDKKSTAFNRNS